MSNYFIPAVVVYGVVWFMFLKYFYMKITRQHILFTFTNMYNYQYFAMYLLFSPFFYNMQAFAQLVGNRAYMYSDFYREYLSKSIVLNGISLIAFFITFTYVENSKPSNSILPKLLHAFNKINYQLIDIEFVFISFLYLTLTLNISGSFAIILGPEFTSLLNRYPYRFLYLTVVTICPYFTIHYGYSALKHKRNIMLFILSFVLCLLQSRRGPLIFTGIIPVAIYLFYQQKKTNFMKNIKLIGLFSIMLFLGLIMVQIRNSNTTSSLISELIYGNTFVDIRDGAWVLSGFEQNYSGNFLYGRPYLASLLSFIPSNILKYRDVWNFGKWTTFTLFGMNNHPGLRTGWGVYHYVNFGYVGVVINSLIMGWGCGNIEKYQIQQIKNGTVKEWSSLSIMGICWAIKLIRGLTGATSDWQEIYVVLVFLIFNILVASLLPKRRGYTTSSQYIKRN